MIAPVPADQLPVDPPIDIEDDIPLAYPGDVWTDPADPRFIVDKRFAGNIEQRAELLAAANRNPHIQGDILAHCSRSCLYWINMFCWTFVPKQVGMDGIERQTGGHNPDPTHQPFITWPVQDVAIQELLDAIENANDALIDKSRDMGATWIIVAIGAWLWRFRPNSLIKYMSATEDEVDTFGDPDSIFWKIEYVVQNLPDWMRPRVPSGIDRRPAPLPATAFLQGGRHRKHLQFENPENGSVISGFATKESSGKGARGLVMFFDEMALMGNAAGAWHSSADTVMCRIANSTPNGPGTEYSRQYQRGMKTGSPRIVTLDYRHHPRKGRNGRWVLDRTGVITGLAGRRYWRTPWLERQMEKRNATDAAQNIFHDHQTSGSLFFNSTIVTQHRQEFAAKAVWGRFEIDRDAKGFYEAEGGRWFIILSALEPVSVEQARSTKLYRPHRRTNYVAFADPSYGVGGANSAIPFMDRETGMVVAEFVDAGTSVQDLVDEMVIAGQHLFGGQLGYTFLGWETNGPGAALHLDLKRHQYPFIYYQRAIESRGNARGKRYGWTSDRPRKRTLLTNLQSALTRREIVIPFEAGLDEMLSYVRFEDGEIGPASVEEQKTAAREAHGDRVIGYAGCVLMRDEAPFFEEERFKWAPGTMGALAEHDALDAPVDEDVERERWYDPPERV